MTRAKKSYEMIPCTGCEGQGQGVFASGNRWICDRCNATGRVSKYPAPIVIDAFARYEPLLDKG